MDQSKRRDPLRVTTLTKIWKDFRRKLSRNEWAVRLLGLSRSECKPTEPGLILVQVDGLSRKQLERAIDAGRMPFLRSLIQREQYQTHSFYSGLPSSTPGVQAELHYGERTAVPAFGFRDHRTERLVRMFANDTATDVEERLKDHGPGLLNGGSSYANIYGGGADNIHFCATSFGWSEFFNTINPLKILVLLLFNFWMFFRVLGLMVIEIFLATFDFVRGIATGRQFWQELIMIPARVVVVVLLRELVTIGTCYDAARGLPIVHLNLLGYDEQAHRRGPESRFAHWTLRGIDSAIRRIWKSAHQGAGREYDVWIFSDHGQETTRPYQLAHGKLIQEVVAETVTATCRNGACPETTTKPEHLPSRANWLGVDWLVSMLFGEQDNDIQSRSPHVQTVTSGPLGFVYLLTDEGRSQSDQIAQKLVRESHVPMTVQATERGARVTTRAAIYQLPEDAVQVFGADHPFLEDVSADMIRLAHHADAGEIVLVGWTHEKTSTSFVLQNGAHAGPGIEETREFALLPCDAPIPHSNKRYLRPHDLRSASLTHLCRDHEHDTCCRRPVYQHRQDRIRLLTYNVHACVGMDGQLSPERIARVISQSGANVVCLQELDVFRHRSGNRDQAHAIAQYLEMECRFHPAWHLEEEQFGNAILTRFPMNIVQAEGLHHHKADRSRRSALWSEIQIGNDTTVQIINTHLSIYPKEQLIQASELLEEWIQPASLLGPVIFCGDFNARPKSATCRAFAESLRDVESFDSSRARPTYFSPFALTRVDHVFVTPGLEIRDVKVVETRLAKVASDHLPLVADLQMNLSKCSPQIQHAKTVPH